MAVMRHKEAIHSGQFMVSEFEADEEDVEDMPEAAGEQSNASASKNGGTSNAIDKYSSTSKPTDAHAVGRNTTDCGGGNYKTGNRDGNIHCTELFNRSDRGKSVDTGRDSSETQMNRAALNQQAIRKKYERFPLIPVPKVQEEIEYTGSDEHIEQLENNANLLRYGRENERNLVSRINHGFETLPLIELFQSMSIAYRQKLTSPKWNRFKGLRLRWKDKIRLNNVIWRCWHLQFIKGHHKLLCAFANPLELEHHNTTEGGPIVQGKYWKRKLETIKNEYMRWRLFYINDDETAQLTIVAQKSESGKTRKLLSPLSGKGSVMGK